MVKKNANKILSNKLKIYKNNPDKNFNLIFFLIPNPQKQQFQKIKKEPHTDFLLTLNIDIEITVNFNNKIKKTFSENSTYDNSENKFDLRKYEET